MAISKQDLCGARTAADIERKYNFGKSFSEVMGFAEQAQRSAEAAQSAVKTLNENLSQEEIFNRLTNNGEAEGIFRGDDGEIYINAEYIVSLSKMFAKDIVITGTFSCEAQCYLPPDDDVIKTINAHIDSGGTIIPSELIHLYDFNDDGEITYDDVVVARQMQSGAFPMELWRGSVSTPTHITISLKQPERFIYFYGTNMWGRYVDGYIGVNNTSVRCPATEARIDDVDNSLYLMSHRLDELEARIKALENA